MKKSFNVFRKNLFKLVWILLSMLLLVMPFVWLQLHSPRQFHSLTLIFSQHSLFFTLFRWSFILLFIVFWPLAMGYFAKKQRWTIEKAQFWLKQRFRLAGWLIIFELLVCENLLFQFSQLF